MEKGIEVGNPSLFRGKRFFHPENRSEKINDLKKYRHNLGYITESGANNSENHREKKKQNENKYNRRYNQQISP
jgi:hypothetical protein